MNSLHKFNWVFSDGHISHAECDDCGLQVGEMGHLIKEAVIGFKCSLETAQFKIKHDGVITRRILV